MQNTSSHRMDTILKAANASIPVAAAGAVFANMACDTGCTYLYGAMFGIDLNYLGIMLAAALLLLSLPVPHPAYLHITGHARACLLWFSMGIGPVLLHFQIAHEVFCPFCLVYGALVLAMFAVNWHMTKLYAGLALFAAGFALSFFFFEGSAIPVFTF